MAIIGIGTDITEIDRIEQMLEKHRSFFLERVFTEEEARYCSSGKKSGERFAARWAAKEAVMKALGTGWTENVAWREIEVTRDPLGKPNLKLTGGAKAYSDSLSITAWHITLSHCDQYAVAYAVAEG